MVVKIYERLTGSNVIYFFFYIPFLCSYIRDILLQLLFFSDMLNVTVHKFIKYTSLVNNRVDNLDTVFVDIFDDFFVDFIFIILRLLYCFAVKDKYDLYLYTSNQ